MCEKDISHTEVFTGASFPPPPPLSLHSVFLDGGMCSAVWLSHQGPDSSGRLLFLLFTSTFLSALALFSLSITTLPKLNSSSLQFHSFIYSSFTFDVFYDLYFSFSSRPLADCNLILLNSYHLSLFYS